MTRAALITLAIASPATCASAATTGLLITEVVDGTLSTGTPSFVEITNTSNAAIDLSAFTMRLYKSGRQLTNFTVTTPLTGNLAPGDAYVINYESTTDGPGNSDFFDIYGINPDLYTPVQKEFNGDDVFALYEGLPTTQDGSDATLIDLYGELGTDGSGTAWEYTDSYAYRNNSVVHNSTTFLQSQWTFGGPNALEAPSDEQQLALILAYTTPGNHTYSGAPVGVPTPHALPAGLLALASLTLRRPTA